MMNMKKLLALLLAVVMVLGMFPMGALADETEPSIPETTESVPETTGEAQVIDVDPCEVCGKTDCNGNHETTPETKETEPTVPETTAPATTEPSVPETTAPAEK